MTCRGKGKGRNKLQQHMGQSEANPSGVLGVATCIDVDDGDRDHNDEASAESAAGLLQQDQSTVNMRLLAKVNWHNQSICMCKCSSMTYPADLLCSYSTYCICCLCVP